MEKFLADDRRFIYILRDPADTLISFWRQLHGLTEDQEIAENTYGEIPQICPFSSQKTQKVPARRIF